MAYVQYERSISAEKPPALPAGDGTAAWMTMRADRRPDPGHPRDRQSAPLFRHLLQCSARPGTDAADVRCPPAQLLPFQAAGHKLLSRVARELLIGRLGVAGFHLLLLRVHRLGLGLPAQALRHELLASVTFEALRLRGR